MGRINQAQRTLNVVRQAISQEVENGSNIDYQYGVVSSSSGYFCSAYLSASSYASDYIRLNSGQYVNAGDYIVAGIYGSDSWVSQILPSNLWSVMVADFERGKIGLTGSGAADDWDFGTDGQVLISRGPSAPAEWAAATGGSGSSIVVNVKDAPFSAVADGVTDDSAAIQAAIDSLPAVGGIVFLPAGVYSIETTISGMDRPNLALVGAGASHSGIYENLVPFSGSVLVWNGASGETMVEMGASPTFVYDRPIEGQRIEHIAFDGNDIAGIGLDITAWWWGGLSDIHIEDCQDICLDMHGQTAQFTNYSITQGGLYQQISTKCGSGSPDGIGIRLGRNDQPHTSVNLSTFSQIMTYQYNGVGIQLNDTDGLAFYMVWTAAGGSGLGIEFMGGDDGGSYGHSRGNAFFFVQPQNGIVARATGWNVPSRNNTLYFHSLENGGPSPVVESGATLVWYERNGTQYPLDTTLKDYIVQDTAAADNNKWTKIATITIPTRYIHYSETLLFTVNNSLSNTPVAMVTIHVGQDSAFGSNPIVGVIVGSANIFDANDFVAVCTSNAGPSVVSLYARIDDTYTGLSYRVLGVSDQYDGSVVHYESQAYSSSLPAGTQFVGTFPDSITVGGGSLSDHTHETSGSGSTGGGSTLNPSSVTTSGDIRSDAVIRSRAGDFESEYYAADAFAAGLYLNKSRNTTKGSHTIVQSGDRLGEVEAYGSDGTAFRKAGRIQFEVDGTPGASDMPGRILFLTSADGTVTPTERMRISQDGTVNVVGSLTQGGTAVSLSGHAHAHSALTGIGADDHHARSHDHSNASDGSTLSPATLNIPATASPGQTTDGQAVWDSDDDVLTIGTGASRRTQTYVGSTTPTTQAFGDSATTGTSAEAALIGHKHAMMANPTTGNMDGTARTDVRKNSTGSVFSRRRLNLIEGSNVTLTIADDSGNEEVDVTIAASGGGSLTDHTHATTGSGATGGGGTLNPSSVTSSGVVQSNSGDIESQYYATDAFGPGLYLSKSRNATKGSHTIVQSGDVLGEIVFYGSNGTSFKHGAKIEVTVNGTPGSGDDMPGKMWFYTTPDGSSTEVSRMTIDQAGTVNVVSALTVGGTSVSVSGHTHSLTNAEAFATAETSISAATYADVTGASISLAAGTWLVIAECHGRIVNARAQMNVAITDGSNNIVREGTQDIPASGTASVNSSGSISMSVIVSPGSTTTYKIRAARGNTTNTGTWTAMDGAATGITNNASDNTDKATSIRAIKVA